MEILSKKGFFVHLTLSVDMLSVMGQNSSFNKEKGLPYWAAPYSWFNGTGSSEIHSVQITFPLK